MNSLIVALLFICSTTLGQLDIAQNVCDFGEKQLKCYTRTLQSDIHHANADVLTDIDTLSILCSDSFFYESILRGHHFGGDLPQLRQLHLKYCKIRQIPNEAFAGLGASLEKLTINSHNSEWSSILMDVDKHAFAGLSHLTSLDLSFNNMWSLPLESLCQVPSLKVLNMSKNHLLDLTDLGLAGAKATSCQIPSIETIDVSNNFISSLRSSDLSETAKTLKGVSLAGNRLTYISDQALYDMTSLQVLNLADLDS